MNVGIANVHDGFFEAHPSKEDDAALPFSCSSIQPCNLNISWDLRWLGFVQECLCEGHETRKAFTLYQKCNLSALRSKPLYVSK